MHCFFAVALTIAGLQGHWMAARYADALASTRSPSRAEKVEGPVAVTINGNRAEVTDFHEGSWRIIKSVEENAIVVSPLEAPDGKPERLPLTVLAMRTVTSRRSARRSARVAGDVEAYRCRCRDVRAPRPARRNVSRR